MTSDDYIQSLIDKQPKLFAANEIRIKISSFKKALRRAYEDGQESVFDEVQPNTNDSSAGKMPPFMKEFFGGFQSS